MTTNSTKPMVQSAFISELSLMNLRFYAVTALFVCGNIFLPLAFHQIPQGGKIFLPIYFFVLVGGYKFGWQVGVAVAILSPLMNHLISGMPPWGALGLIIGKSVILGVCAGLIAKKWGSLSLAAVITAVLLAQAFGFALELLWTNDFSMALKNSRTGTPGILLQIIGGYGAIRFFSHFIHDSKKLD